MRLLRGAMQGLSCGVMTVAVLMTIGCQDLTQDLPNGTVDPRTFRTPEGAVKLYHGVKHKFVQIDFAAQTGYLTDELQFQAVDVSAFFGEIPGGTDARNVINTSGDVTNLYRRLHDTRNQIDQTIGMLGLFPDDTLRTYRGELFALHGLVLTYLAEAFCSGVPLSRVDFDGDFTYVPGISRDSVLAVALAQYDSAAVYAGSDSLLPRMIAAGRARTWMQRDSVRIAASYAAKVSPGFRYELPSIVTVRPEYRVSDREGLNGVPYRSNGDPRSAVTFARLAGAGTSDTFFYVQKIASAATPVRVMSAIEAALIVAEAALIEGQSAWLEQLNALRTNGTFVVSGTDTVWNAGTGSVAGLRPLTDPGLDARPPGKTVFDVRLDLILRERAYWLFLTGTRLGDLRRLVRHYRRPADTVYPTGAYGRNGAAFNVRYGTDLVFPVPSSEQDLNPYYHGCFDLEA